jgi:hypothetical protein
MYEVKDGSRKLQFEGTMLGKSSSWRRGSNRWIEFELYKTDSNSYVLSRIGVSIIYHGAGCHLVKRYELQEADVSSLHKDAISCEECNPDRSVGLVFPEKYRHWAQVSEEPKAVLEALYKYDSGGARYLTNVAQRLLEVCSEKDSGIESIYKIEIIP